MWHEIGPNRQNAVLIVLAVLVSALVGVGIPLAQSGASARQARVPWTPPTATAPAASPAAAPPAPPTQTQALAVGMGASGGDLIAWQEPGQATPSSTPEARPATPPARLADFGAATPGPATTAPQDAAIATVSLVQAPPLTASRRVSKAVKPAPEPVSFVAAPSVGPAAVAASPTSGLPAAATPGPQATVPPAAAPGPAAVAPPNRAPASAPARPTAGLPAATPAPPAATVERPANATPPALLSPALDARLRGLAQFDWLPTGDLPQGALYEVVVWSPEQDPNQAWGVAPPRRSHSLTLNLDELFQSGRFLHGDLYWTVLVVEENPYRRLTLPTDSERRYLVYASDG